MKVHHIADLIDMAIPNDLRDYRPGHNTIYYENTLVAVVQHASKLVCIRPFVAEMFDIKPGKDKYLRGYRLRNYEDGPWREHDRPRSRCE